MDRGFAAVCCGILAFAAPPASAADLRAEQITPATASELVIGGPDAVGGLGDWYLANDVVEVVVDDPGRRYGTVNHGGTLVDAGLRGRRDEDQLARLFPLVNLSQRVFVNFDTVRAEVDEAAGTARLVVSSRRGLSSLPRGSALARRLDLLVPDPEALRDVFVETEYAVFPGEPFVRLTTTIENRGSRDAPVFAYADVWMRGGRSLRAFVADALAPERSRGFHHDSFDRGDVLGSGEVMASFTHVVAPGLFQFAPIAYALVAPELAAEGRVVYGVTGSHVTVVNAFVSDPGTATPGLLDLARSVFSELAPGERWTYRRRLLVTAGPDVASATDVILPLLGAADGTAGVQGGVEPAGVRASIQIDRADGAPVTQAAPGREGPDAGRYRATLPPGDYVLTVRAPQRSPQRAAVRVEPGAFAEVPTWRLPEPGFLLFDPPFADGGPGRVVVQGVGETPDPVFGPELLDFRLDGRAAKSGTATRDLVFGAAPGDPRRVAIPPGRYRLTATRGLLHDVVQLEVEVPGPGAEVRVPPFAVDRVISLPGTVAADLHVHAEASEDSSTTHESRLRSFAAEGVEVLVSTDHEHVGHYAPALRALGLGDRVRVVTGVELTSGVPSAAAPWTIGHHNAWPVTRRPLAHRRGAPPSGGMGVADLYAQVRDEYGARVVQLNHPRDLDSGGGIDEGGFFHHLAVVGAGLDPTRPFDTAPNAALLAPGGDGRTRPVDFDALELMNGRGHQEHALVRADWYALLRQGLRRTATANSDTHGPSRAAGYPRNYVRVGDRRDPAAFDAAIREGRLFGTNGPIIEEFTAGGGGMGDTVRADGGRVRVRIAVSAAPWVPVDEVRLLVNGEVVRVFRDLPPTGLGPVERVRAQVDLALERDAFLTLEAGAPRDVERDTWLASHRGIYTDAIAPRYVSTAFANPIYVRVDENERFDPPGIAPSRGPRDVARALSLGAVALVAFGWLAARRRVPFDGR